MRIRTVGHASGILFECASSTPGHRERRMNNGRRGWGNSNSRFGTRIHGWRKDGSAEVPGCANTTTTSTRTTGTGPGYGLESGKTESQRQQEDEGRQQPECRETTGRRRAGKHLITNEFSLQKLVRENALKAWRKLRIFNLLIS